MENVLKAAVFSSVFLSTGGVKAVVFHNNLVPAPSAIATSDFDASVQVADDFNSTSFDPIAITRITFNGLYEPTDTPPTDDFTIRFFKATGAGGPSLSASLLPFAELTGVVPTRVDTGVDFGGSDLYEYTVDVTDFIVIYPIPDYVVSIVNDTSSDGDDNWAWTAIQPSYNLERTSDGGAWTTLIPSDGLPPVLGIERGLDLSIRLEGIVAPEPNTPLLLLLASSLLFSRRRRR